MRDPVERWGARVRVKRRRVMCVRRNDGRSVSAEMDGNQLYHRWLAQVPRVRVATFKPFIHITRKRRSTSPIKMGVDVAQREAIPDRRFWASIPGGFFGVCFFLRSIRASARWPSGQQRRAPPTNEGACAGAVGAWDVAGGRRWRRVPHDGMTSPTFSPTTCSACPRAWATNATRRRFARRLAGEYRSGMNITVVGAGPTTTRASRPAAPGIATGLLSRGARPAAAGIATATTIAAATWHTTRARTPSPISSPQA